MGQKTTIEWTATVHHDGSVTPGATWSPIRSRVKLAAGDIAREKGYTSLVKIAAKMAGHVGPHCERCSPGCDHCYSDANNHRCLPQNGTGLPFDRRARDLVEVFVDEAILTLPFHWKRPRRIFVENQSDLFGDWVPVGMINRVFHVMAACQRHTFQVLTKRAEEMLGYRQQYGLHDYLPNCWMGVSVENRTAKSRIDCLRETPAAVRFLSVEPLLEDIGDLDLRGIDWVIVGAESGSGARPCEERWVRSVKDQCVAARVPLFYKQAAKNGIKIPTPLLDGRRWMEFPEVARHA